MSVSMEDERLLLPAPLLMSNSLEEKVLIIRRAWPVQK